LLGSYTENGNSTNSSDGTAIFLGFADLSAPDITSVVFTYTAGAPQGFILDTLQMNDSLPVIAPEPGTLSLGLFGLMGLMLWRRRTLPN
jgi:PEP-CTERM motif